ncbi:hypothetical protein OOJ91_33895 [Micromonospora lupini]|uniref:hypothetical protein n=1 Tax=Micromonospora lupini TaxID=285679 RepID=UPI00225ABE79|nr:hypothetical protein [Micromonospora lupini]MCX5070841.1 hypothetical protein [Micromonospora lupini]
MSDVAEHSRAQRAERKAGPGWSIGASDAGKCRRSIQYRESPPAGYVPLPEDTRKADVGTAIHEGATIARRARYPWRIYKLALRLPGLDKPVEIDEYDPITATATDWKTSGDGAWDIIGQQGPWPDNEEQLDLYGLALDLAGYPIRRLRLMYIRRENGEEETFEWLYDRETAEQSLSKLVSVGTALDLGVDLPRDRPGPSSDRICQLCPARAHCWNLDAAAEAGRSGESYTILGPDPDDPTIEWAAALVAEANAEANAAEKRKKELVPLLEGVRPGEYGDYEVYRGASTSYDHKGANEKMVELWKLPEALRPAADTLPRAERRRTWYTQVRLTRAARRKRKEAEKAARAAS